MDAASFTLTRRALWHALGVLVLLAGPAWLVWSRQERAARRAVEHNLESIAELKSEEVARWRDERLNDASDVMAAVFLYEAIDRWLQSPESGDQERILQRLGAVQRHQDWLDVLVVDAQGHARLSVRGTPAPLHREARVAVEQAIARRAPVLSTPHAGPQAEPAHLDVIAPLFARDARTIGAVVLRVALHQHLGPLVERWPIPSETAESLLGMREGDAAVFITAPRYRPEAALRERYALAGTQYPVTRGVRGQFGLWEGPDYRGVAVISCVKAVRGSDWVLVAKMDSTEALAGWRVTAALLALLLGGTYLILLAAGVWVLQARRQAALREQALAAAEGANQAKSSFLAAMSHELRTPLNGIMGMAQLLAGPDVSAQERVEHAHTIFASGQALLTILNDILDLSKVEAGHLRLEPTVFSPQRLLEEAQQLFHEVARERGLELRSRWEGPAARYVGDAQRLRQMISNLVSNAVKFTERGEVLVTAREGGRGPEQATLRVEVADTGEGIPEEKRKLLFEPFSQLDTSSTRRAGGTGLGLSIVRQLAQRMGGTVGLEARDGRGNTFWFEVQVGLAPDEAPLPEPAPAGAALEHLAARGRRWRILVAEDNAINRTVIVGMLRRFGFLDVDVVENGRLACDALVEGRCVPDLILMDIQMPELDGTDATRLLRKWESDAGRARIPVVALTAGAYAEDRERCLAAGMDDFLSKPVTLEALHQALARWLR